MSRWWLCSFLWLLAMCGSADYAKGSFGDPTVKLSANNWVSDVGVPGFNGPVWAVLEYGAELIAGGDFTEAGGQPCIDLARWDGTHWQALGPGAEGVVLALGCFNGALFVGGQKVDSSPLLARWDGAAWADVSSSLVGSHVSCLASDESSLYVGGDFSSAGGTLCRSVASWNGQTWSAMGTGVDGAYSQVACMLVDQGSVYVGGNFTHAGEVEANFIARWDGATWHAMGSGMWGPIWGTVFDLRAYDGRVVAGGMFERAGGSDAFHVAAWDGVQWSPMGQGMSNTNGASSPADVTALETYGHDLFAGGMFNLADNREASRLARWDGCNWHAVGGGVEGFSVDDLSHFNGALALVGRFTAAGDSAANNAALWRDALLLSMQDIPDDEGGMLAASWAAHIDDLAGASPRVVSYDLQVYDEAWLTMTTLVATGADSYSVSVPTSDVLVLGEPEPWSEYRLLAHTENSGIDYESNIVSAYSLDNLAPQAPILTVYDSETYRYVTWQASSAPDFQLFCLYRGEIPGFPAGSPLECGTHTVYHEQDLLRYFYRARAFDIHGNPSEWSNEVVGQYPTSVPGATPTTLRLYPNQPNPFNPMTTIRFDLPEDGRVRLRVYDVRGGLIRSLVDADMLRGSHQAVWDGTDSADQGVPSGSYFARLEAGGQIVTVPMGLLR